MALNDTLVTFRDGLAEVNGYIDLAFELDVSGNHIRTDSQIEFIVSSAFLRMFIIWESSLESAFIQYLLGEPSSSGGTVTRYASPIDTAHAHKIVTGSNSYVGWSNHETVKKLAKIFFEDGEPFSTSLNSISSDLSDLRTIRNAAAHTSTTTQHKLDAVASRKLGRSVSGIGVTEFVTTLSPDDSTKTILQHYLILLEITVENITSNTN